jgi:hypothetical protein
MSDDNYIVTFVGRGKAHCPCGANCPLTHAPIDGPYRARLGIMDWGDGFKTTMMPLCEARKAWRGEWPEDLRPPTSVPIVPKRK